MSFPALLHPVLQRLQWLRTTKDSPRLYTNTGTLLVWLALPVSTLDFMMAPDFFAPNPECDGRADSMMSLILGAMPWAVISFLAVSMVVVPATDGREGGADIFDVNLGAPPWNWMISLPILALFVYFASHLWDTLMWAGSMQTVTDDCGGEAERVTVSMTAPYFQFKPVLEAAICLWLLHIRALALSPRVPPA